MGFWCGLVPIHILQYFSIVYFIFTSYGVIILTFDHQTFRSQIEIYKNHDKSCRQLRNITHHTNILMQVLHKPWLEQWPHRLEYVDFFRLLLYVFCKHATNTSFDLDVFISFLNITDIQVCLYILNGQSAMQFYWHQLSRS